MTIAFVIQIMDKEVSLALNKQMKKPDFVNRLLKKIKKLIPKFFSFKAFRALSDLFLLKSVCKMKNDWSSMKT